MRKLDAPPRGWYPDPEHRTSLRWWDGLDWTDVRRAPPSAVERTAGEEAGLAAAARAGMVGAGRHVPAPGSSISRQDAQEIIAEVRNVARSEVDRAAQEFSDRATSAARSFTPLISEYTNKFVRWVKFALVVATIVFVAWFTFQLIAQQSLFDWFGDRIDNITNDTDGSGESGGAGGSGPVVVRKP